MNIVFFDDNSAVLLPFTYMKSSWNVEVGGITLKDWVTRILPDAELYECPGGYTPDGFSGPHIALNGRLLPSPALAAMVMDLSVQKNNMRITTDTETACIVAYDKGIVASMAAPEGVIVLRAPWEIVKYLGVTLLEALSVKRKGLTEVRKDVWVGEGVQLDAAVVTRTEQGPIVIGEDTVCGSFVVLEGPLVIGARCVVRDQAMCARASIGDVCKIGGEIEDSVMDAYSNKQHYGYLGHSIIGSWANLGAGTTTSDLKHTYGTVRVDRGAGKEETGMQFCGSFLGEGVKTSINSSLMSGTVVGLNAFIFGTARGYIPPFTSMTAHGFIEIPLEIALTMRARMMERRTMPLLPATRDVLRAWYERSASERIAYHVKKGPLIM